MSDLAVSAADAIAERVPVDWDRARRLAKTGRERTKLRTLRQLASLARPTLAGEHSDAAAGPARGAPTWLLAASMVASIVVAAGITGVLTRPSAIGVWIVPQTIVMLSFAVSALTMAARGHRDVRVMQYAGLCMLMGAAFARPLIVKSGIGADWLNGVYPEVFLPAALWAFARRFPHTYRLTRTDQIARLGERVSLTFAVVAFTLNALAPHLSAGVSASPLMQLFSRANPLGLFWVLFYLGILPALASIVIRSWSADDAEQRRTRLFTLALAIGSVPIAAAGLVQVLSSPYRALMDQHHPLTRVVDLVVWAGLISVPLITAYAVTMRRALPVRALLGQAARFLLARHSLAVICGAMAIVMVSRIWVYRDRPLTETLAWLTSYPLIGAGLLVVLWVAHRRTARWVDRVFSHRAVDHSQHLPDAIERIRSSGQREAGILVCLEELQTLFAPTMATALIPGGPAELISITSSCPPLARETALAWLARRSRHGLRIRDRSRVFDLLPGTEQKWLLRTGAELFVPVGVKADDPIIVAAARRDGLPYSDGDRRTAATLAAAIAPPLSDSSAKLPFPRASGNAFECPRCNGVEEELPLSCRCGVAPVNAAVPKLVAGKIEVHRRVGAGGMGVVYYGTDKMIHRPVALKTLHVQRDDVSQAVLREARAMAAAVHPHLAQIFSVELVGNTPVLVVEWLPGGTLAARLEKRRLPWREAVLLGHRIADALTHLHATGLIHKDIKPSNIAYAADGSPKLMDFGVASLSSITGETSAALVLLQLAGAAATTSACIAGTPLYLSPEIINGAPSSPAQDLWALALVLYEAIVGGNPFYSPSLDETVRRIRVGALTDVRSHVSDVPKDVAHFLTAALSLRTEDRPRTSVMFAKQLSDLLANSTR